MSSDLSTDPRSYDLMGEPPPIEQDWPVLSEFVEQFRPVYPPIGALGVRHVFRSDDRSAQLRSDGRAAADRAGLAGAVRVRRAVPSGLSTDRRARRAPCL